MFSTYRMLLMGFEAYFRLQEGLTEGPGFRRLRYCRECGGPCLNTESAGLEPASHFPLQMYGLREESLWQIMFRL